MNATNLKCAAMVGLAAVFVMPLGCRYDDRQAAARDRAMTVSPYEDVKMRIEPSRREAVVGEMITFTARTEDLLGREADIRWSAPAGELQTQQDGRVARVIFDEPGTYSVTAVLYINEFEVRRDMKTVTVRPLR